eukprot:CAMPEP_0174261046 /NCGR_PEP_ID=MMETSP0439-20130205/11200_1 /TAXON_ID=0 /ORGANISM="Stereomyxa ramosa, Strain Chinc5" /LENGTH=260 /DNA_ID=CAMNT_0015345457 /DNA_START=46 /DNA_END=825 /DNA_ORIENTATION=+
MGNCGGAANTEGAKASKEIDKELRNYKKELDKEVKLLLLGTGASGKSTVAKQMQIIYLDGFDKEQKKEYRLQLISNLYDNMQKLLAGAQQLDKEVDEDLLEKAEEAILPVDPFDYDLLKWDDELCELFTALWKDKGVQSAFAESNKFQLDDSASYFFEKLEDYADMDNYQVNDDDILRVRKRTTGVIETDFENKGRLFRMVDVGGQRNERKKWIHCFEDVTAIIYVASLSEYNQVLEEDGKTNRMKESLHLFDEIINNEW